MTSIIPAIKATPAVIEYQKLSALVDRRTPAGTDLDSIRFWLNLYSERGLEIANRYNMTMLELVDAWCEWTASVDAARADYMAKVGA